VLQRLRRPASVSILGLVLVAGLAGPTQAWSNGPNSGNGYGTHDWIVSQALDLFDGSPPSWLEVDTALQATDDPDTQFYASNEHVFYEQGYGRGAVDRITKYFHEALVAHADGDDHKASIRFGWMAHYYGDILQPYHTNHDAVDHKTSHRDYELLVEADISAPGSMPEWAASGHTPTPVNDIRKAAIAAAAYSRGKFPALYSAFHPDESKLNGTVRDITGKVLKRASEDLADALVSIDQGVGDAPVVGSVQASVKYVYAARNEKQPVYVTVKDGAGHPLEGVRVDIDFPKASGGTTLLRRYTMADGTVTAWGDVGKSPFGAKRTVQITVTTRDVTKTASPWFMATRQLMTSTGGFKTWVNDSTVKPGQTVRVIARTRDTKGNPVADLKVTWTWTFSDGSKKTTSDDTNAHGKAHSDLAITSATPKGLVKITATTQAARKHRTTTTSFRRS
jgi:hypothetical protein